jgi:hypothetical protein
MQSEVQTNRGAVRGQSRARTRRLLPPWRQDTRQRGIPSLQDGRAFPLCTRYPQAAGGVLLAGGKQPSRHTGRHPAARLAHQECPQQHGQGGVGRAVAESEGSVGRVSEGQKEQAAGGGAFTRRGACYGGVPHNRGLPGVDVAGRAAADATGAGQTGGGRGQAAGAGRAAHHRHAGFGADGQAGFHSCEARR